MGDFRTILTLDGVTVVDVDSGAAPIDPDDLPDVVAIDGLTVGWDAPSELFPLQPNPATASFSLWCPEGSLSPLDVRAGVKVTLSVDAIDHLPANDPFVWFAGRVTDTAVTPLRGGLLYAVVAVEHLAVLNEERVGEDYFDVDPALNSVSWQTAWPLVNALSDAPFDDTIPGEVTGGASTFVGDRPEWGAVPTSEFVEAYLSDSFQWSGYGLGQVGGPPDFQVGTTPIWFRMILCQDCTVDPNNPTYRLGFVCSGVRSKAGTPYKALAPLGAGQPIRLVRRTDAGSDFNATQGALYLDGSTIVRDVTWRQDKSRNRNVMRLEGNFLKYRSLTDGEVVNKKKLTVRFREAVTRYGRILGAKGTLVRSETDARIIAAAYLGPIEQTVPGYTFDQVVVDCRGLDDAHLPRAFTAPDPTGHNGPAYGRFVLVEDIAPEWNLSERAEFPGRLVGAVFTMSRGVPTLTLRLWWNVGYPNGDPSAGYAGITMTELVAAVGAGVTWAQLGDLTTADFKLTSALIGG